MVRSIPSGNEDRLALIPTRQLARGQYRALCSTQLCITLVYEIPSATLGRSPYTVHFLLYLESPLIPDHTKETRLRTADICFEVLRGF